MKLDDLFVGTGSYFKGVVTGAPLKVRNMYNKDDLSNALTSKPSRQTITIKNNSTGQTVGKRTIWQA